MYILSVARVSYRYLSKWKRTYFNLCDVRSFTICLIANRSSIVVFFWDHFWAVEIFNVPFQRMFHLANTSFHWVFSWHGCLIGEVTEAQAHWCFRLFVERSHQGDIFSWRRTVKCSGVTDGSGIQLLINKGRKYKLKFWWGGFFLLLCDMRCKSKMLSLNSFEQNQTASSLWLLLLIGALWIFILHFKHFT